MAAVAAAAIPADDLRLASPGLRLAQLKEELIAWVKTLVSAAVYAILIVTFGFQVARVEGQSMAPTLEDQDRLIVNKLVYRIGEPRRGDIVMLYYPLNPDKSFVKRVIAEEGDTVRIIDGRVYVNDIPLQDDYVPQEFRSHDDYGPQVVQQGYYFVMGDHRNNSSDSRHWGQVPKKYIVGKVKLRWWPLQDDYVPQEFRSHDDYVPEEFRSHDDWGPSVIQQGYYFVMGDHRNNSSDSRHWGPVPKKYIVGKVKVRWWPLQDAKIF